MACLSLLVACGLWLVACALCSFLDASTPQRTEHVRVLELLAVRAEKVAGPRCLSQNMPEQRRLFSHVPAMVRSA